MDFELLLLLVDWMLRETAWLVDIYNVDKPLIWHALPFESFLLGASWNLVFKE